MLKVDRTTLDYRKFKAAGFTIGRMYIKYTLSPTGDRRDVKVHGKFKCVCGKVEHWAFWTMEDLLPCMREYQDDGTFDLARMLMGLDALSKGHLRKDGYSEEQIEEIYCRMEAA